MDELKQQATSDEHALVNMGSRMLHTCLFSEPTVSTYPITLLKHWM